MKDISFLIDEYTKRGFIVRTVNGWIAIFDKDGNLVSLLGAKS